MKLIDQINESAIFSQSGYSADTATHDSLGNVIADTYISAISASANITVTKEGNNKVWISGKDWTSEIQDASANAVAQIPTGLMIIPGLEYNENNEITGYSGSAFHAGAGGDGKIYTGISPIVVDNSKTTGTISAQTARLGVQSPLYFVEDTSASTVIGISGLPQVEGVMYESALNFGNGYITGYNGSALSSERSRYAVSSTSANGAVSSQTAAIVTGGWETANGKITGYNGTAFYAGSTGKYIPYTNISTGDSGTQVYNVNKGIRVTAASGWVEMYNQNKENENEAHLQIAQNYSSNKSFWTEIDGAGGGFLQMNWNSGTISPNMHYSYSDGTTAAMSLGNGALVYCSANSALTSLNDEASKVWQLGSERLRFWNSHGSASFGPTFTDVVNTDNGCSWSLLAIDSAARLRVHGSAGNGSTGTVDLTPGYINFYRDDSTLWASLTPDEINALKALLNHVSTASASWANPSIATGSI